MKFFQKRWVAWTICICLVISGIVIGQVKQYQNAFKPERETAAEKWAWDNYSAYEQYISDEKDIFSDRYIRQLSVYNAIFDYTYDTVCGIWIPSSFDDLSVDELTVRAMEELQLGSRDLVLLYDAEEKEWLLRGGDMVSPFINHDLELLIAEANAAMLKSPNMVCMKFFSSLSDWNEMNLSTVNDVDHLLHAVHVISRTAIRIILLGLIIAGAVIALIVVLVVKASKRNGRSFHQAPSVHAPDAHRTSSGGKNQSKTEYTSNRYQAPEQDKH